MKEKMLKLKEDIAKIENANGSDSASTYPSPIERNMTMSNNIKPVAKAITKTLQEKVEVAGGNKK